MKSQKGFSLLETLVATMILAGALIALSNSWSGSMLAVRKARSLHTIATLLQQKVTEMEIKYADKSLEEMKEEETGDFGAGYPGYRWKVEVQKFPAPDLTPLVADKEGAVNEMMGTMMKQISDYLEKTVIEMRVTVYWKSGKKETEHSITTTLVDYNKDIPLGGAQ